MINANIHYKWSFSIAMLNYQRVYNQIVIGVISFQVMASMGSPVNPLLDAMAPIPLPDRYPHQTLTGFGRLVKKQPSATWMA